MFATDFVSQLLELFRIELDHRARRDADKVVVHLPASDHFVVGFFLVKKDLSQDSGVLQVGERSVYRRA